MNLHCHFFRRWLFLALHRVGWAVGERVLIYHTCGTSRLPASHTHTHYHSHFHPDPIRLAFVSCRLEDLLRSRAMAAFIENYALSCSRSRILIRIGIGIGLVDSWTPGLVDLRTPTLAWVR